MFQFLLVHVIVTDGPFFISPAGSDQLHQDLESVDGHRPNLQRHEVGGLDVRNLFKLTQQRTSLIVEKSRR